MGIYVNKNVKKEYDILAIVRRYIMYYYGGYQGYGNSCGCGCGCGYGNGYGYGTGYGAAIILVLFILLIIILGARAWK